MYKIGINGGDRKSEKISISNETLISEDPKTQQELADKLGVHGGDRRSGNFNGPNGALISAIPSPNP